MKKTLLYAASALTLAASVSTAQNVQPCNTYGVQDYFIKNLPGYKQQVDAAKLKDAADFKAYKQKMALSKSAAAVDAAKSFTIPVVFHVLHSGQATGSGSNVSDATLIAAIDQVNKDFQRKGSDTTTIDPLFEPLYVNSKIHFKLAKKDPQGNCTNGIVRHYDENTAWTQTNIYNYKYSTVGTNNWNPQSYLNIYIVDAIIPAGEVAGGGTIVGYTYLPGSSPNVGSDAIVYDANFLSGVNSLRSLSHEIGHWLGLSHTFGGSNNAGVVCGNDDIDDTPATAGYYSTCPNFLTLNDSCQPGTRPNMQNIMDYSGCPKMFTQGQIEKMRYVLSNSVAKRDSLVGVANLIKTGLLNNTSGPCAPIADFWTENRNPSLCAGQSIKFVSTSYNSNPTSYAWTFEGGAPATSTVAAPTINYSTPGVYPVSLTVTNANGSSTTTRENFILTSWNSDQKSLPYSESFENGLPQRWSIVNNNYASVEWTVGNYGSQETSKSMLLPNGNAGGFANSRSHIDILETEQFDFSNTSALSISYDYSFARKPGNTGEQFKFDYSLDCGSTWNTLSGNPATAATQMAASGGTMTVPYIPNAASKWITRSYTAATLNALNNKRDVKFRFWFQNDPSNGEAQNLYIDEFKISGTVGINEFENSLNLSMYPNPTATSSVLEFISPASTKAFVNVYDVTGRLVDAEVIETISGSTSKVVINKNNNLKQGIYFINLSINNQQVTKKLIIE